MRTVWLTCSEIDKKFPKSDKNFTLVMSRDFSSLYLSVIYMASRMARQLLT